MTTQSRATMSFLVGTLLVLSGIGVIIAFLANPSVKVQLLGRGNYRLLSSTADSFFISIEQLNHTNGLLNDLVRGKRFVQMRGRKLVRTDSGMCESLLSDNLKAPMEFVNQKGAAFTYCCEEDGLVVFIMPTSAHELAVKWAFRPRR